MSRSSSRKSTLAAATLAMLGTTVTSAPQALAYGGSFRGGGHAMARPVSGFASQPAGMRATFRPSSIRAAHVQRIQRPLQVAGTNQGPARVNGGGNGGTSRTGTNHGPGRGNAGGNGGTNNPHPAHGNTTNGTQKPVHNGSLNTAVDPLDSQHHGLPQKGANMWPSPTPTPPTPPTPQPGPVQVTPVPPVGTGGGSGGGGQTGGTPTPMPPCMSPCGGPRPVGIPVVAGGIGGVVVVQNDAPAPVYRPVSQAAPVDARMSVASNTASSYQAMALAWNNEGSWVVRKSDTVLGAIGMAFDACKNQYGSCRAAPVTVQPTSFGCMAIGRSSQDPKALFAASRGSLEEARAAALESMGAPGNADLIVYAGCNT